MSHTFARQTKLTLRPPGSHVTVTAWVQRTAAHLSVKTSAFALRSFIFYFFSAFTMRPDHVLPKGSEAAHGTLGKIYSVHVIDGATTNWTRPGEKLSSTCHAEACMAAWHKTTFHCFQTCQAGRLSCSCCADCRIHLHLFIGTSHTSQYCPVPAPDPNVTACLLQSSCLSPPCRLHHCARGGAFPCS